MEKVVRRTKRPLGQPTRGKTARNRLRRVDNFLLLYGRSLLQEQGGAFERSFFVDVGYGAAPFTVLESAERLRLVNAALPVLGVEIDPERVAAGLPYEDEQTFFRLGGFNLPLLPGETARVIRAFNVLRQYEETAVSAAHQEMGKSLVPGGLLIEGTSDPFGRLWVANLLRKTADSAIQPEGLLFSTNFREPFAPSQFQPVLPKNFIHRMVEGEPIEAFFAAWRRAYLETLPYRQFGERQLFVNTAQRLAENGYLINKERKLLSRGYLLWYTPNNAVVQ